MKKYAFLFGNTNRLPGVQKDLKSFRTFLMSNEGGAWRKNEISELYENLNILDLKRKLLQIKLENYDYLIVYFSGHGGSVREKSYIYPSGNDFIEISELENLAIRQLNVYDCCRSLDLNIQKSMENFSMIMDSVSDDRMIREIYDKRIEQAAPQQMNLYSCDLGETSIDDDGGVYTKNLLKAANTIDGSEKLVIDAHEEAAKQTSVESKYAQNPKYKMLKLRPELQLVISIKLNYICE